MNLFQITIDELNWLRSLGRKLWRLTPKQVSSGVLLFMASQLFLLLALLMPLKVILLVATEGVPWYLEPVISVETKDEFVVLLALGAIASYGVYHLCTWAVNRAVAAGSQHVLASAKKLYVFNNQEELAEQGYLRFVRTVASGLLAILGFAAGLVLNPPVFGTLVGVIVLQYLVLAYVLRLDTGLSRRVAASLEGNLGVTAGVLSSVNFLLAFALLLVQFLNAEQLSVIIAILSIILTRQILQRCAACVQDLGYLSSNRLRLMTLFYTSIRHLPFAAKQEDAFLAGLRPAVRNQWLAASLSDVVGEVPGEVRSRWIDSGTPGLAHLEVSSAGRYWLVKYYSHRHALRAAHEAQLFASHPDNIPGAPRFEGEAFVDRNRLLVFEGFAMQSAAAGEWKARMPELLFDTWSVPPDPELVVAYQRTHSTIVDRLDGEAFAQMEVAMESESDEAMLATLTSDWPEIRELVAALPLVLRNPALTRPTNWMTDPGGAFYCLNWNNWSIEPIGCEPMLLRMDDEELEAALARWREASPFEQKVAPADLYLVARLVELEGVLHRKEMRQGLDLLARIVAAWHASGTENLSVAQANA